MTVGAPLSMGSMMLVALLLTGCSREIVRPLQVNPDSCPQIVIFHHITQRTAPLAYVIDLNDDAVTRWKGLAGGDATALRSGQDFKVSRGHLINGNISILSNDHLEVQGTLELTVDAVVIDLDIRPGASRRIPNHPIDGRYRLTEANTVKVHAAEGG